MRYRNSPRVIEVLPFTACDAFLTAPLRFWNCGVPAPPERDLKASKNTNDHKFTNHMAIKIALQCPNVDNSSIFADGKIREFHFG